MKAETKVLRRVVIDTETTGLSWRDGNRLIEIACIEIIDHRITGRQLHFYLNPDREIEPSAQLVHGITTEFLADKPKFGEIVDEFLTFIEGAEMLAHNSAFDVGFIDNELSLLSRSATMAKICECVTDTLTTARELRPGMRNDLDSLCQAYGVDNATRKMHGAMLDATLLAEVYLIMTDIKHGRHIGSVVSSI